MNDKVSETDGFQVTLSDAPIASSKETIVEEVEKEETLEVIPGKSEENKIIEKDDSSEDTTADKTKHKSKGGVQKRIDKVVREREDAKRANEALSKKNKELETRLTERKEKTEEKSNEPIEADFDTYDDYLDALDKHDNKSSSKTEPEPKREVKKESSLPELTDSQKTSMAIVQEKVNDAANKPSDFNQVALAKDIDITAEMLEALAECDDPVKVMYHLGKNKKLATEIAGKTPAQQMREITRLDLTVKLKPEKLTKKTNAADPISPVGGSDAHKKNMEDMSFKEFEAEREAQTKSKKGFW